MMATNLATIPESYGRNRVRPIPIALSLLYALEPAVALLSLICLSPFLVILALAIRAASGASPLVAHRRVGRYGKTLWVYKFRTMWPGPKVGTAPSGHGSASASEARPQGAVVRLFSQVGTSSAPVQESGFFIEKVVEEMPKPKLAADPRVTSAFAAFCRRHSIDELPQLALIVAGRMSVVGPRPITQTELSEYYDLDATEVLSVKPGLTGLWQICGRSRLTYRQRKRFDLFLVRRLSAGLYLRIVALTIPDVLFAKNAR